MGTRWEGGTHHTTPVVPAGKAVTLSQQLDDVELVVVAPDVGLVQGAGIVFMHLGPEGAWGRQAGSGRPGVGQGTQLHTDRGLMGKESCCTGASEEALAGKARGGHGSALGDID